MPGQYPVWMTQKPRKGDLRELNPRNILGEHEWITKRGNVLGSHIQKISWWAWMNHMLNQEMFSTFFTALRANFCKYRESGDSFKIFNFFIFSPNKAFSELFSKIQLKDPKALEFFQNRGKFENRHFGLPPPLKIDKNDAFSFRSCW